MKIKTLFLLVIMFFTINIYSDDMSKQKNALMEYQLINNEKLWHAFNEFFKQIEKTRTLDMLDRLDDQIDAWNIQLESLFAREQNLSDALCFVLRDEIQRSEKRLYSSRGKGQKPNWRNNLTQYSQRLAIEKLVVSAIADTINEHKISSTSKWKYMLESFQFSIELVAVSIEQTEKQIKERSHIESSDYSQIVNENKQLLQDSQTLLKNILMALEI